MDAEREWPEIQVVLDALSSPIRREILWLIWDAERPAGEIAAAFELTAPTISEHLATLRRAGLVTVRATGTFRHYRANLGALRGFRSILFRDDVRWQPADEIPERVHAAARSGLAVMCAVEVGCDRATAFEGFANPAVFGRWLGVPVSLEGGRFACTLEWGTAIRGFYDVVARPDLLALRWDFDDERIPVPGGERIGYVRFFDAGAGSRVEVHQLVDQPEEAAFMEVAWSMVLGRFHEGIVAASEPGAPPARRRPRSKRIPARP